MPILFVLLGESSSWPSASSPSLRLRRAHDRENVATLLRLVLLARALDD